MSSYEKVIPMGDQRTKSYKLANLAYIALFGGIYALTYLGIRNAKMLKLQKLDIVFLIVCSVVAMLIRMLLFVSARSLLSYIKLLDITVFFVYYAKMRVPYRLHIVFNDEIQNMGYGGKAILICIASIIFDFAIITMINIMIGV